MTDAPARPVRVVQVLWRLSRLGGVQTVVRTLCDRLDPAQVQTLVVTARPRLDDDGLDELGVEVTGLGHGGSTLGIGRRLRLMWAVARVVRRQRGDVAQLHSGTLWLGMAIPIVSWGTRCLIEVHDAPGSGRHGRLTDQLEKWWAKAVRARVVCHSTSVADAVVRHWGIPRSRVELIPLAVDLSHVGDPGTAPGPPGTLRVLAVGRLVASKRFDLAITAVADAPGVHLDIVGEGPEHQRLAELARSLAVSDRVRLVGSCGPEDLAAAMGHCDVVLSASDYEGFGLVLVEAMAAGRPVVATAVGGVTDIVLDGVTGRLVPAGDVAGLRGALVDLRDDPDLRRRLGTAGRRRVEEHFDVATMVAGFVACYRVLAR